MMIKMLVTIRRQSYILQRKVIFLQNVTELVIVPFYEMSDKELILPFKKYDAKN